MLKIEKFKKQDISSLLNWLEGTNDRFLCQFAGPKYNFPLTKQQLIETIESEEYLPFKFIESENSEIVGHFQFMRINLQKHSAALGRILMNPAYRGKGFGTKMLNEIIDYSKNILNLKKLNLKVYDFNEPAIRCYNKIGFIETQIESIEIKDFNEIWKCISMEYTI